MKYQLCAILTIIFASAFLSCKNNSEKFPETSGLIGRWKQTELLFDPTDGTGSWIKLNGFEAGTLEFKPNGDFKEVKSMVSSSLNLCDNYKVVNDTVIELGMRKQSSNNKIVWHIAELSSQVLILNLGCKKRCLAKYVPIK